MRSILCALLLLGLAPGWALTPELLPAPALALNAQERVEERHALDPDGRLSVQAVRHRITVSVWDRDEVEVVATLDPEREELRVTGSASDLRLEIREERRGARGRDGAIELRVPREARLDLGTVSGGIRAEGVAGTVRLATTSGSIALEGSPTTAHLVTVSGSIQTSGEIQDLRANAVSGSITARGVRGDVEANTVSGALDLTAAGPLRRVRGNSVSGRITLTGEAAPGASFELQSHSGRIDVRLPRDTPADYDLEVFSGSIRNGMTEDEARSGAWGPGRTLRFRVGDGTIPVRIQSFSGGIELSPLG